MIAADNACTSGRWTGPRTALMRTGIDSQTPRSPQLAQAAAVYRKAAPFEILDRPGPFQISRKVCCVASPNV